MNVDSTSFRHGTRMTSFRCLLLVLASLLSSCDSMVLERRVMALGMLSLAPYLSTRAFVREASTSEYIHDKIEASDVVVFAKSYCPYCKKTRHLLTSLHVEALWSLDIVDIDLLANGAEIQNELLSQTGQKTVPNIFIAGAHIGGNSDLQQLYQNGKLEQMLDDIVDGLSEEM